MTKAILQYADANDNMGQGAIRLFNGDEAFVREFYNAYLQDGEMLDMWDAPTVDIGKLAEQLDGIQGINRQNAILQNSVSGDIVETIRVVEDQTSEAPEADTAKEKRHVENPFGEDGKLLPDVEYESGEFNYTYKTDSQGRISHWGTTKLQITSRLKRLHNAMNTPGKLFGDHAGHLAADIFGGSNRLDNLVSQLAKVNQSTYRKIEIEWQKAIKSGKNVSVSMDVLYEGDNSRPSVFVVEYFVDGKGLEVRTIQNK